MVWKLILLAALLVLGVFLILEVSETDRPEREIVTALTEEATEVNPDLEVPRPDSDPMGARPDLPLSPLDGINRDDSTPESDVRLLAMLFNDYASVFKRMPLGMHQEIVAGLQGDNPRSIVYVPQGHPAVTANQEIVDRWGKPYFFHVISRNAVEIISAGPDGELFTQDDVKDVPPHASVEPSLLAESEIE